MSEVRCAANSTRHCKVSPTATTQSPRAPCLRVRLGTRPPRDLGVKPYMAFCLGIGLLGPREARRRVALVGGCQRPRLPFAELSVLNLVLGGSLVPGAHPGGKREPGGLAVQSAEQLS